MKLKLAHLILAHAHPKQLERLVSRLQHPDTHIYIHIDKNSDIGIFDELQNEDNVFFIRNREAVQWGTYSLIRATLNSMLEILDSYDGYSHINLLSAQDYPLKNADDVYAFFMSNTGKSFIDMPRIGEEWPEGLHRTVNYNFGDYLFKGHYVVQYMVNFARIRKPVPDGMKLYGRSQWFTITPECVRYVVYYLNEYPQVKRYFRMSFAPDEFLFQTILGNSTLSHTLVNDNLRYINFPSGNLHPATLTVSDAMALTASGKLYARKFNPNVDPVILNYLDWIAEFGANTDSKEFKCLQYVFNK